MSTGYFIADLSMLYFKKLMFEKSNNKYFVSKYMFLEILEMYKLDINLHIVD